MEMDTKPTLNYNNVTIRPLHCRLNAQAKSDGSSMLTQGDEINNNFWQSIWIQLIKFNDGFFSSGDTAVTVSVNGPIEVKTHNLQIDKAHVEVLYRSKAGLPTIVDKLREQIIRETCESALLTVLYPRSSIFLQIHEMEDAAGVS